MTKKIIDITRRYCVKQNSLTLNGVPGLLWLLAGSIQKQEHDRRFSCGHALVDAPGMRT